MLGVFLDSETVDRGDIVFTGLEAGLPHWRFHTTTSAGEVAPRIADADVVVTNKVLLDAAALGQATRLRLICVAATGTNNVDLAAAHRRGIVVCNVRGYATPSVVQHVFALILALSRRLPQYHAAVRDGLWRQSPHFCLLDYPISELTGKTLGIVGYGELGQAVAHIAEAFGMRVLIAERHERQGAQPRAGRMALHELLPQADVLSLHCPLTPETRNLIGGRDLALMKPSAILINAARGGIVEEQALAEALREGKLAGAGVDVLTREPPREGNPLLDGDIPNLIVTPHIAWASREARQRLVDELTRNVQSFLQGAPRNVVS